MVAPASYWFQPILLEPPPLSRTKLCKRTNHPPVGPFVFSGLISVRSMGMHLSARDRVAILGVQMVNWASRVLKRGTVAGGQVDF
jgi:hypothetical protein